METLLSKNSNEFSANQKKFLKADAIFKAVLIFGFIIIAALNLANLFVMATALICIIIGTYGIKQERIMIDGLNDLEEFKGNIHNQLEKDIQFYRNNIINHKYFKMQNILSNLKPAELWRNFEILCDIPRPSKKESNIIQYVNEFGKKIQLETVVDQAGNVLIKKPATAGMENKKTIILQAHLDMVPQKNRNIQHDFEKDPIIPVIEGN